MELEASRVLLEWRNIKTPPLNFMYIDVNVSFGFWPFQICGITDMGELSSHLESNGIRKALVSHLGTVFYPNAEYYNRDLLERAKGRPSIVPIPVLNLGIPGWEKHLEELMDECSPVAVKIIPSYHFFSLDSDQSLELSRRLESEGIPLLIQMRLEDERNQYKGLNIQGVPTGDIINFNKNSPSLKVICLNAYLPEALAIAGETNDNLGFDISFTERSNTVDVLTRAINPDRLFFGSHTPILYTRSATMKVEHSNCGKENAAKIASTNAAQWFELD